MRNFQARVTASVLLALFASYASPQMPTPSAIAPTYNDADKKRIAEIEQRPEVKDDIQNKWDDRRRRDLDYIYNVNSSARFGDASGPEFATFRDHYGMLYNNPMLQRYLNDMGQRLVPKDSPNIYSFKILLDPIPKAESFSTGTVLVSTGLISMLDNEAQLAYVLGHEIAHVEKNHFYEALRMEVLQEELNKEKQEVIDKKRAIFTAAVTTATAGIGGGVANGLSGAIIAGALGFASSSFLAKLVFRDHTTVTEWPDVYENDADQTSIGYLLNQNYDVREAPKLYARMETEAAHDPRIGLGFIAQASRMKARNAKINELLSGPLKTEIEAKLKGAGLTGSSGEFNLIMATLKRDNGIIAIDYDLFAMARDNLEEAVSLRTDDARAQLYLGKVISLTARNEEDKQLAEEHFTKAIQYDQTRGAYPDPHLEHAIHLIGTNGDKNQIRTEIESYVALFQRQHAGALPNNMAILYDYLNLVGEPNWYAAPAEVISTRNVEPLRTSSAGPSTALTGPEVIANAVTAPPAASGDPLPASASQPTGKSKASLKKTAAK